MPPLRAHPKVTSRPGASEFLRFSTDALRADLGVPICSQPGCFLPAPELTAGSHKQEQWMPGSLLPFVTRTLGTLIPFNVKVHAPVNLSAVQRVWLHCATSLLNSDVLVSFLLTLNFHTSAPFH